MRLGLDATAVHPLEGTGIQSYAAHLSHALLEAGRDEEFVVYCRREVPEALRPFGDRATFRVCGLSRRKLAEQLWLPWAASRDRLDLLHCLASLPLVLPGRSVLTVHGLSWRLIPEVFTPVQRFYWRHIAELGMRRATRLITASQWTRGIARDHLGLDPGLIDVVYHGIDHDRFRPPEPERVAELRERGGLAGRFVLFVGALLPVKNLPRLVEAYARLIQRAEVADVDLVIAGGRGWRENPIYERVKALDLERRVHFTGFVASADLPVLYGAAEVFVLPSLYEGFGIPLIEAFACGTPVISTSASCIPEVTGGAALLVEPTDVDGMADTMHRVLTDRSLRDDMARRGLARAAGFTWERSAREVLTSYRQAHEAAP